MASFALAVPSVTVATPTGEFAATIPERREEVFALAAIPYRVHAALIDETGLRFAYGVTGVELTEEQVDTLEHAAQVLSNAPPPNPYPTRVEGATIIPSPGLVLDLGTGSHRYGTVYCETVNVLSDAVFKRDVETLSLGRAFVDRLRPVSFHYASKHRTHFGFIAQEVRAALDEVAGEGGAAQYAVWCESPVCGADTGYPAGLKTVQSLRPDQLIAVLVRCCQEQDDLICDLQSQLGDVNDAVERHTADIAYCYDTIAAIQKAIRERPPPAVGL